MEEKKLENRIASGFLWKAIENGGDQLITFVISLILARILGPERYGSMAVMLIFVSLANVIIQNGFQTALIQKKEADQKDFSSVFWMGLLIAAFLYLLMFLLAPQAAIFFEDPQLSQMLRVFSLILFPGAAVSVEIAIIARKMNFRVQAIATMAADLISGACGIVLALAGAGTWALIWQQITKFLVLAVWLMRRLRWRPDLVMAADRLSALFSYGWKVLVSGLIDTVYTNLYTPVISRLYNTAMVGLYSKANQFPQIIANAAASTMQSVMLPAFSRTQDEKEHSRALMRQSLKLSSFLMFPMMFGLAAVAPAMVGTLLGADWMGAVPLLQLCAIGYSVWHIHVINLQAINGQGRSDIYLKLEIIKKCIGLLVLIVSVRFGVTGMILVKALWDYVCTAVNAWPNEALLGYGPIGQWKDVLPEFLCALLMGVLVAVFGNLISLSPFLMLVVQIGLGVIIYLCTAAVFRLSSLRILLTALKNLILK